MTASAAAWLPAAPGGVSSAPVEVWCVPLERPDGGARFERLLSPQERARAERFHFAQDKARFVIARGALRVLLGRRLGRAPEQLIFAEGAYGKPQLAEKPGSKAPAFNVSHSGAWALIAIGRAEAVGVDVERIRFLDDLPGLAKSVLTEKERLALLELPQAERPAAFFRAWTLKEAYMKATGRGFSLPPERFSVAYLPDHEPRLLEVEGAPGEPARWSLAVLPPLGGYAAALAVAGPEAGAACWNWPAWLEPGCDDERGDLP